MSSTEDLIDAVRPHPVLYDTSHPDYMKGSYKDEIWAKIAAALHFLDGAEAKDAWLKLRNCHRDALRRQKKLRDQSGSHPVIIKSWRFQQQMDFLLPYMANRETNSTVTWTFDDDCNSFEEGNTQALTASRKHPGLDEEFVDGNGETTVDPTAHAREVKKRRTVSNRIKRADVAALLKEPILTHDERVNQRGLDRKEIEENMRQEERDPLYHFFMAMYTSTAEMPPALQHQIKRDIFRLVSEAEETLLGMSQP